MSYTFARGLLFVALCTVAALSFAGGVGFGIDYSRSQIRSMAEDLANTEEQTGTNSFSRCLTEMWEQTGELDPKWKGKRNWRLNEVKP